MPITYARASFSVSTIASTWQRSRPWVFMHAMPNAAQVRSLALLKPAFASVE